MMKTLKRLIHGSLTAFLLLIILFSQSACDGNDTDPSDPGQGNVLMTVSGNVTSGAAGLPGVTVTLSGNDIESQTFLTDTTGSYSFNDLAKGNYRITPGMTGYAFSPAYINITLPGADSVDNNFTATADGSTDDPGNDDPADPGETVKLVFVGDINLGRGVGESVVQKGKGDYNYIFTNVASYLGSFDLTIGNLESIISDKGTNTKANYGVSLRAVPEAIKGLTGAGFDIVSVANNHTGDYNLEGMTDSFARIEGAGIKISGGGSNRTEARSPVINDIKGVRIACLSYTSVGMYMDSYYMGTRPVDDWIATAENPGIAWAHNSRFDELGNLDDMADDIKKADMLADVVVVMIHFGTEYEKVSNDFQKLTAHAAIDAGADLVIGHHPHVTQETEMYNGGYIAYSLGNFVFDQSKEGTDKGMVVEATIADGNVTNVKTRNTIINDYYQVSLVE